MVEKTAIVRNAQGIHCRPSAAIIKAAGTYVGDIRLTTDAGDTDLRSLLALVTLGIDHGDQVRISVEGPDEASCCAKLAALFETQFDFVPLGADDRARAAADILGSIGVT